MTAAIRIPGHEKCEYLGISTEDLNKAYRDVVEWLAGARSRLLACEVEYNNLVVEKGQHDPDVIAYAEIVHGFATDLVQLCEIPGCFMAEIMNRAYAENANRDS